MPLPRLLDAALDRSIAGGYSRLGWTLRRPGFAELPRMDGRVAVVTGATSGIGQAAAAGFAALGASVVLVVRDRERGERARRALGAGAAVELLGCDVADLDDARRAAAELAERHPRVDALVHNAGVLPGERRSSPQGHELTLATNVLGPFLLTALLHDRTRRVITVASGGLYASTLDVARLLAPPEPFSGTKAYAQTKRAEVVLTELWAQRLDPARTVVHAMHPGWVDTPGLASSLPRFHRATRPLLRTAQQGADTIVWLGAAELPLQATGRFWHDRRERPTHYVRTTREPSGERERLWSACVALTGVPDPARPQGAG
jgi:NAD(P)-dependent dehydrogenase (short-subunit alcohol dehydrogenase family)